MTRGEAIAAHIARRITHNKTQRKRFSTLYREANEEYEMSLPITIRLGVPASVEVDSQPNTTSTSDALMTARDGTVREDGAQMIAPSVVCQVPINTCIARSVDTGTAK